MTNDRFHLYDTTLRDGAQKEGVSYTVDAKLEVAALLDRLGVGFIEGGWPGAVPKDTEFFRRARSELPLRHATLVAFGATRRPGGTADGDRQVRALLESEAQAVCLVAKADLRHVSDALRTTPEENLAMIEDTVRLLVGEGRRVFVDCEHFFDGYQNDPDYALRVVTRAWDAGAEVAVLCDTNGGMLPMRVHRVVSELRSRTAGRLGIHCQDDTGCAVANTLAAVDAGATHAQCTANGYGERTGNADLFTVVGNLVTKMGMDVLPQGCLAEMTPISRALAEIAGEPTDSAQPYVGSSAFAHKAGLHASAIKVRPELYNHLDPAAVGNTMRILVTELAGRASIELKGRELGLDLAGRTETVGRVVDRIKDMESRGWSFEAADASFELMLRDELGQGVPPFFRLESYRVVVEHRADGVVTSEATVRLHADGERIVATAEGSGPVNALDRALRDALKHLRPELAKVELTDYSVRILATGQGSDAVTRVLITTGDDRHEWTTVGVHDNLIEASWLALEDANRYGVLCGPQPAACAGS
ncbi:citramalate synthase [Amycolatopsis vastitatis]|uniref:Citramalate synthase n=1 Tax=Amycolatopsis vastitatis TaxID=1905142 RepID=A0A229SM93_9PSEU|nr:citramalate synthase [Amycolatopsis vastitatis]OXM59801.1 citramalate synthase [Amycolatopsis vastitatis]